MITRYSFKSLFRTPIKTILFFLLLTAVTVFLILGVSMLKSSDELLKLADEQFTTVAQLDYIGANFPDSTVYDEHLEKIQEQFDFTRLQNLEQVKSYEPDLKMRGYIGNFQYRSIQKPYEDMVIIAFKITNIDKKNNTATCMLTRTYYAYNEKNEGLTFYMSLDDPFLKWWYAGNPASHLRVGHTYIAHGSMTSSNHLYGFTPMTFNTGVLTDTDYLNFFTNFYGYLGAGGANLNALKATMGLLVKGPVLDITSNLDFATSKPDINSWQWDDMTQLTDEQVWQQIAYSYKIQNESVNAILTDDLETIPEFQQGLTYLTSGRYYTTQDGANVVIISDAISKQLKLEVGDTLDIKFHSSSNTMGFYDSYYAAKGFLHESSYTIVGIYKAVGEIYGNIYMPQRNNSDWLPKYTQSYTLGRFIIENGKGAEFSTTVEPLLQQRMKVSVYDQGYMAVAEPLKSMRETSFMLVGASVVCAVSIMLLFAYMFVTKQVGDINTMLALGAGERYCRRYLSACTFILALAAIVCGGGIGYFISDNLLQAAYDVTAATSTIDMRYSSFYTGATTRDFAITFNTDYRVVVCAILGALVLAIISCLIFTNNLLMRKRVDEWNTSKARSRRFFGAFKFAYRSLWRNKGRSIIVPIVTLIITMLLMLFCVTLGSYTDKINAVYDNVSVDAYFTTVNGSSIDDLLLYGETAQNIYDTGYIRSLHYTYNMKYFLEGYNKAQKDAEGYTTYADYHKVGEFVIPQHSFSYETAMAEIVDWNKLVFTNDLYKTPELFYTDDPTVVFADGYDNTVFLTRQKVCAVSTEFAKMYDLRLGDKISLMIADRFDGGYVTGNVKVTIVALYTQQTSADNIFCPMELLKKGYCAYNYTNETQNAKYEIAYTEDGQPYFTFIVDNTGDAGDILENLDDDSVVHVPNLRTYEKLSSLGFTLKDAHSIVDFKQWLQDNGYGTRSHLGANRLAITIDDTSLINSISGLTKISGYMEALYPVIFALTAVIGFIVSYLITKSRRNELAIMRSMGSGSFKAFAAFFLEQSTLCLIGTLIGFGVSMLLFANAITPLIIFSVLLYLACYFVGAGLSTVLMNKLNVLKILSANE